jgi:NTP pyrophosphatase (non-canonical NTP hydrolase)
MTVQALTERLREFAARRDWGPYHTPKNLVMALCGEAGELIEHFQWLTPDESEAIMASKAAEVEDELADVFIYLVRLADVLGVDLMRVAHAKIERNESRFPVK